LLLMPVVRFLVFVFVVVFVFVRFVVCASSRSNKLSFSEKYVAPLAKYWSSNSKEGSSSISRKRRLRGTSFFVFLVRTEYNFANTSKVTCSVQVEVTF